MLVVDTRFGWGGIVGVALPAFFFISMNGLIVANSVSAALADFPHRAGAASALLGATHYGSGILSAALVGWFADETPWTMGWVIGLYGINLLAIMPSPRTVLEVWLSLFLRVGTLRP